MRSLREFLVFITVVLLGATIMIHTIEMRNLATRVTILENRR